jgi:hypothetical protein
LNGNQRGQQQIKLIQEMPSDKSTWNEIKIMRGKNTLGTMISSNTATVITTMKESTGKESERRDLFLGNYLIFRLRISELVELLFPDSSKNGRTK